MVGSVVAPTTDPTTTFRTLGSPIPIPAITRRVSRGGRNQAGGSPRAAATRSHTPGGGAPPGGECAARSLGRRLAPFGWVKGCAVRRASRLRTIYEPMRSACATASPRLRSRGCAPTAQREETASTADCGPARRRAGEAFGLSPVRSRPGVLRGSRQPPHGPFRRTLRRSRPGRPSSRRPSAPRQCPEPLARAARDARRPLRRSPPSRGCPAGGYSLLLQVLCRITRGCRPGPG